MPFLANRKHCKRLDGDPHNTCLYNKKRGGCSSSNSWVEFLTSHGVHGTDQLRGKSAAAKKRMYSEYKNGTNAGCQGSVSRGANFDRNVQPTICDWIGDVDVVDLHSANPWRWKKVYAEVKKRRILLDGYDPTKITPQVLANVAKVVNRHVYENAVNIDEIEFSVRNDYHPQDPAAAMTTSIVEKRISWYVPIWVDLKEDFDTGLVANIDQYMCNNMVELFVHILAHELAHYISAHVCKHTPDWTDGSNGHDRVFLALNNRLNGHSTTDFCYSRDPGQSNKTDAKIQKAFERQRLSENLGEGITRKLTELEETQEAYADKRIKFYLEKDYPDLTFHITFMCYLLRKDVLDTLTYAYECHTSTHTYSNGLVFKKEIPPNS
eukprot:jgi/Mesvir1/18596/Mv17105-RA.1